MEQAPRTPPALATIEDPPIPLDLRTIRANNRAVRQGRFTEFQALLKLEKSLQLQWAKKALLEKELEYYRADPPLDKSTQQRKKRKGHPDD